MSDILTPWVDFMQDLDPIIALNGTEKLPGINPSLLSATVTPSALFDYVSGNLLMHKKVTVTSPQILTANSAPIRLLPIIPAYMMYVLVAVAYKKNFVSTQYTTSTDVIIGPGTIYASPQFGFLNFNQSIIGNIQLSPFEVNSNSGAVGAPINFFVTGTNPTAGNGTVDIYLTYYTVIV